MWTNQETVPPNLFLLLSYLIFSKTGWYYNKGGTMRSGHFFVVSRHFPHAIPFSLRNFACLLFSSRVISSFHNFSLLFSLIQLYNLTFCLCSCFLCVFLLLCDLSEVFSLLSNSFSNVFDKQLYEGLKNSTQWPRNHEMSYFEHPVCLN